MNISIPMVLHMMIRRFLKTICETAKLKFNFFIRNKYFYKEIQT